jgi:hypothetical protein
MSEQSERVEFLAIIPSIASAIKFAGDEGARVTLDVDGMNEADMLPLLAMRGKLLKVVIEVESQ